MKIIGEITRPLQEKTCSQVVAVNAVARPLARRQEATPEDLLDAWLDRRSDHTRRAYQADLEKFAAWLGTTGPAGALAVLVSSSQGEANRLVFDYCHALRRDKKSPATINRHLAAIGSVVKLGRSLGLTQVSIDIPRERHEAYRDTRGPSPKKVRSILAKLERQLPSPKACRDYTIVRLLWGLALRVGEVTGLDLEHYDRQGKGRLHILAKARSERQWVTLSPKAKKALEAWLKVRGAEPGPLFTSMFRNRSMPESRLRASMSRLCPRSVWRMTMQYGVNPHAFRHSAITAALAATNGNVAEVQRFSRHTNPATVMLYNDRRLDKAAKVAGLLDNVA